MPRIDTPGASPDRAALFKDLRAMWLGIDDSRTSRELAALLSEGVDRSVSPQRVSQWAAGSDAKHPCPWWVLMRMCRELGVAIVVGPDGCEIAIP